MTDEIVAGIPVVRFTEIESTSRYARALAHAGMLCPHPIVFVAERQTAGVGRFDRSWHSPTGGLWMTFCWPLHRKAYLGIIDGLGLRIGVACRAGIQQALVNAGAQDEAKIKWPNDVLVNGRKVLGVLTEVVTWDGHAWVLVGVGVNVNAAPAVAAGHFTTPAGTLADTVGSPLDIEAVRLELVAKLAYWLPKHGLDGSVAEASKHLASVGESVPVTLPDGRRTMGTLRGLDASGQAIFDIDGQRYVPPIGSSVIEW